MGLVLGPEPFFYPSQQYFDTHQSRHRTEWGVVPTIARCNSGRNLNILFTCRKLWEEGWQHILLRRRIIFDFNFDVVDDSSHHNSTAQQNARWLPSATIILHNLNNSTHIWGTFDHLERLSRKLSENLASPFVAQAVPERRHLILKVGIHQMQWGRYPHDYEIHLTRKEYEAYSKAQRTYYYYTELHGVPYINARNGHDIEIAKYLRRMTHWRRVDIVLLLETLESRCWCREVTDFLDTLGPEIGLKRGCLSFRPRYFQDLKMYLGRDAAYKFMLGRKHFSDDVMDDMVTMKNHSRNEVHGEAEDGNADSNRNGNNRETGNSDDNGNDTNVSDGHSNHIHGIEPDANHQSSIREADWHRRAIDAINESELKEALRLSAAEAVGSGRGGGPGDEGP
ncbi:hypothetical protein MMC26_005879 [Xylographa opegraphella]|nr:hypothetical protein [Xylographa opegraphella]